MKEHFVDELIVNDEFTDLFLVKEYSIRVGSNNKQYLDILLADKTGEIRGKKWDVSEAEADSIGRVKVGDIIKIRCSVSEWNGVTQLRIAKMGRPSDTDIIDKQDFIKAAPELPEDMFAYIEKTANGIVDADFKKLLVKILGDNKLRLMYYPAAAKNHHAIFAGLLYHMKRMLMLAEKMTEVYPILDKDMLLTGVIMHDIEKLNEMDSDENGTVSAYTFEGTMLGHLVGGVAQLETLCGELDIPYEKKVMLQHMVISHHYEPEYGSPKKPLFPEAEALHYLDMFDSKMYDFEDALQGVAPGKFSDRVWTLDNRKVYKREFGGSDR